MDSILISRFYTDISTSVFDSLVTQLLRSFCKIRKASLFIFCMIVGNSNINVGIDSGLANIKSMTVILRILKTIK